MDSAGYYMVSLTEFIRTYGRDVSSSFLRTFVPLTDTKTADYLYREAIPMEMRDLSRTYLAVSSDGDSIWGYVTIGMKCIRIPRENLLSGSLLKQCNIDESTGVAQAYLLGQLARSVDSPKGFGKDLMEYAIGRLRRAKEIVGCRIARLDCNDGMVEYYKNSGFKPIRRNHNGNLVQMIATL